MSAPEVNPCPPGPYILTPFKWRRISNDPEHVLYRADNSWGGYTVERSREDWEEGRPWEPWRASWEYSEYYGDGSVEVGSLKEGKEWCWNDWCRRVAAHAQLVTTPPQTDLDRAWAWFREHPKALIAGSPGGFICAHEMDPENIVLRSGGGPTKDASVLAAWRASQNKEAQE